MDGICPDCQSSDQIQPGHLHHVGRCPTCGRVTRVEESFSATPLPPEPGRRLAEDADAEAREAEEDAVRFALDRKWAQSLLEKEEASRSRLPGIVIPIAWPIWTVGFFLLVMLEGKSSLALNVV